MRRSVRRAATLGLVAIVLLGGIAYLGRDALRVCYHRVALGRVERSMLYQMNPPRTVLRWISAGMPWRFDSLWEKFWYHEDALVELGYLARHEFPFTNLTLNAWQIWTNGRARFASRATGLRVLTNGQSISPTVICTASVVQVTAPRAEAEKWRALVNEFDRTARESQ